MEDLKQRKKNLIMFPLGTVGRDMIYYLFTSCIITFVLFTRNLTNAQFGAITAIVVAARIFDALNDPIMGNIIERTRTRLGQIQALARHRHTLDLGRRVSCVQHRSSGLELCVVLRRDLLHVFDNLHDARYLLLGNGSCTLDRRKREKSICFTSNSVCRHRRNACERSHTHVHGRRHGHRRQHHRCLRQNCAYNLHNRSAVFVLHNFRCA